MAIKLETVGPAKQAGTTAGTTRVHETRDHSVEIVSDSGEGAQKCGQIFGAVSAKMGNGVWTVEIIPAEVEPPPRSIAGASGIRIRLGDRPSRTGATKPTSWWRSTSRCSSADIV
jgi:2-oxoglutarate/2-oxoacid ferredoxin oxidoreductase subunit alpha